MDRIEAIATETRAALVEIPGEDKGVRYNRIRRLTERCENLAGGYDVWTDENKALRALARECFRFRAFGAK